MPPSMNIGDIWECEESPKIPGTPRWQLEGVLDPSNCPTGICLADHGPSGKYIQGTIRQVSLPFVILELRGVVLWEPVLVDSSPLAHASAKYANPYDPNQWNLEGFWATPGQVLKNVQVAPLGVQQAPVWALRTGLAEDPIYPVTIAPTKMEESCKTCDRIKDHGKKCWWCGN